ncbi:MAG TPA: BtpA/SgcQ family protein [Candidatus Paceibacterota bacterium]|nr:BtpA/SgcQ family protein [Candidatus Paceibacterota bacterium]
MKRNVRQMFKKEKNIIIGAIHFPPLLGYAGFPGLRVALRNALADLSSLQKGGVDGIIIENNYDVPHKAFVDPGVVACMTLLGKELRAATTLPLGISVLWNDYRTALSISKVLNLDFVRIPVFVDKVRTQYGVVEGNPRAVRSFQKSIQAEHVMLFTDIHVKHATLLSKYSLLESASLAIKGGADVLIVTGRWTGDAPRADDLNVLREKLGGFPIFIGSGINSKNVKGLFRFADGAIVSTSIKNGIAKRNEVNVKPYTSRIDFKKTELLVRAIK